MEQELLQIRVDKPLKQATEQLFSELGLDIENVVRVFFMKCINEDGLPFIINEEKPILDEEGWNAFMQLREQAERNGLQDMSLEEINAEISAARAERRMRKEM